MSQRHLVTLICAAALSMTPILGASQHGGMGGGGGMPAGGSMARPIGGSGMPSSMGMGLGRSQSSGMSGARNERRAYAEALRRAHRDLLEFDPSGNLVVRNELVGFGASEAGLAAARAAGFTIIRRDTLIAFDAEVVVVAAPPGMSGRRALRRLSEIDPLATYDFNHIYFVTAAGDGVATSAAGARAPVLSPPGDGRPSVRRVGLIDGGVEASHPALSSLTPRNYGCHGTAVPSAHGTATASRLGTGFGEVAPDTVRLELYIADVYCGAPTGGSADAVIQGLAWLMQEHVPVVSVSLVGPPNVLLQRAVEMATARGYLIVAAVGNDGPTAPPLYPAAYSGVIAVTGVDRTGKVLIEAGRGKFVAFAAPGADIEAASLPNGYSPVRGTSFAAPIVAGRLALLMERPDRIAAERAVSELAASAVDLGPPGRDSVYGSGCIGCTDLRAAAEAARAP